MATILYKWLFVVLMCGNLSYLHPIFVSITEIEHNAKEKTLEVSCKVYTDDFEKALRKTYNTPIDLIASKNKDAMNTIVNDYISKHLSVTINDRQTILTFVGYEQIEEGIYCYFQGSNISTIKKISVTDNIMYDYKKEQVSVLHITVNGNRKSTKLNNPADKIVFTF